MNHHMRRLMFNRPQDRNEPAGPMLNRTENFAYSYCILLHPASYFPKPKSTWHRRLRFPPAPSSCRRCPKYPPVPLLSLDLAAASASASHHQHFRLSPASSCHRHCLHPRPRSACRPGWYLWPSSPPSPWNGPSLGYEMRIPRSSCGGAMVSCLLSSLPLARLVEIWCASGVVLVF